MIESSSFKDPSGFIFYGNNKVYRQINKLYSEDYKLLIDSGLYDCLIKKGYLVSHKEVNVEIAPIKEKAYKVIEVEKIKFISYPYEWSFSQLKAGAELTLKIQEIALDYGMSLKDATPFNIQFIGSRPVFIDTLSFEKYDVHNGWNGYKQFCETFLSPLALASYSDIRLLSLSKYFFHGIPLDFVNKILPVRAYLNLGLLMHIKLHSKVQNSYGSSEKNIKSNQKKISIQGALGIIKSLESCISKSKLKIPKTEWGNYYENTNYDTAATASKKKIVSNYLEGLEINSVLDIGANNGEMSRLASTLGVYTISCDIDPVAVEYNYLLSKKDKEENIITLLQDIANPSPDLGWRLSERASFRRRNEVSCVLALAVIHHMVITYNLPIEHIAQEFSNIAPYLIIEFIPKTDSQIKKMLRNRNDIFSNYNKNYFESIFSKHYELKESREVINSERCIYLCERR